MLKFEKNWIFAREKNVCLILRIVRRDAMLGWPLRAPGPGLKNVYKKKPNRSLIHDSAFVQGNECLCILSVLWARNPDY